MPAPHIRQSNLDAPILGPSITLAVGDESTNRASKRYDYIGFLTPNRLRSMLGPIFLQVNHCSNPKHPQSQQDRYDYLILETPASASSKVYGADFLNCPIGLINGGVSVGDRAGIGVCNGDSPEWLSPHNPWLLLFGPVRIE